MSRRNASKKIHYVRAAYNSNKHPNDTFRGLVKRALVKLPGVASTRIPLPAHGDMGVAYRHSDWENKDKPLKLVLAAGAEGEAIGTFGANTSEIQDSDITTDPPLGRSFKLAEAFVLIEGDEVLVCTDGTMRGYKTVSRYFRSLLDKANLPPETQSFEFEPVSNQDKRRILEQEGVASMELSGTMYAATAELNSANGGLGQALREFKQQVQRLLGQEVTQEQQEVLSENWANFNVKTVITPKGKTRAEPVVLDSLDSLASDIIDEIPDDTEISIETRGGNTIKSGDVILSTMVSTFRKQARNDLDHYEMWKHLDNYRQDLIKISAWES